MINARKINVTRQLIPYFNNTITEKIFSNISKTTSYKQFVWMTPSCSTKRHVEIIFRFAVTRAYMHFT